MDSNDAMNILHLNNADTSGGAALAGYRLHQGLLSQGADSYLLVREKHIHDRRIACAPHRSRLDYQLSRVTSRLGLNNLNVISSFDIPKHPFYKSADILNLHNLHSGFLNYLALPALTKQKPAIWTLHDMWSFTVTAVTIMIANAGVRDAETVLTLTHLLPYKRIAHLLNGN